MAVYNVVGSYYKTPTENVKFYPITRYDNIDTMGTYARNIPGGVDISGVIPFTQRMSFDTNPTWATQQADGKVVINRAGYYDCNIYFYAPNELQSYYFAVALRCKRASNVDMNMAENFAESLDGNNVVMVTLGGLYYFNQGDTIYGNVGIDPGGGIHPNNMTSICIKPYQFETIKYWG